MWYYTILGITATLHITWMLVAFVSAINTSVEQVIVHPIESTWEKVQTLKKKPMLVMSSDFEKQAGILSMMQAKEEKRTDIRTIDKSLMKIAQLLALGFGEAGANILVQNLQHTPVVTSNIIETQGERVVGIYAFCDIRNFTDATEVLQTKVMSFVN